MGLVQRSVEHILDNIEKNGTATATKAARYGTIKTHQQQN